MHPGGIELTKLAFTRLEDNLICHRHRGDRLYFFSSFFLRHDMVWYGTAQNGTVQMSAVVSGSSSGQVALIRR